MIYKKLFFFTAYNLIFIYIKPNLEEIKQKLQDIHKTSFDSAMKINQFESMLIFNDIDKNSLDEIIQIQNNYELYKKIYNEKNIVISPTPLIPKIVHQIWLGSDFPEEFRYIADKWINMHPDWQYKLWTDKNIYEFFPLYNHNFFCDSKNYGEKSDILRYEILNKYGGFYVDIDYECIKSFDFLCYCYSFVVGIEPIDASKLLLGNAIIGSSPGHPILQTCIHTIKDFRNEATIPQRTGPAHLTRSFLHSMNYISKKDLGAVMTFPTSFLYPLGYLQKNKNLSSNFYLSDETLGVHYWRGTWVNSNNKQLK